MSLIPVKVDPKNLSKIKDILLKKAVELKQTNKYEVFRLKIDSGLAIAYATGMISITEGKAHEALKEAIRATEVKQDKFAIGSDEAGKGEWLGPLVVAAVALLPDVIAEMRAIGVMDSKKLTTNRIEYLSSQIKKLALSFKMIVIPPKRFNQLFRQLKQEGGSLNDILAWAHTKAIKSVYEEIKPKNPIRIVIDEFDRIKTAKRLGALKEMQNITIVQKPRAEEEIPVACASILARAERERWITAKSKVLKIDLRAIKEKDALKMENSDELFKVSYLKER